MASKEQLTSSREDARLIKNVLKKYESDTPNEELCKKIWEELAALRAEKKLSSLCRVVLVKDREGVYPPRVDVVVETKQFL